MKTVLVKQKLLSLILAFVVAFCLAVVVSYDVADNAYADDLVKINRVAITGLDAPTAGQPLDRTVSVGADTYVVTKVQYDYWSQENVLQETDTDKVEPGYNYAVTIYLDAKAGYKFVTNSTLIVTVNGSEANTVFMRGADDTQLLVYHVFDTCDYSYVYSVELTVTEPLANQTPDFDPKIGEGRYYFSVYNGAHPAFDRSVAWVDLTSGVTMNENTKFVAGHSYAVYFSVFADMDWRFDLNYPSSHATRFYVNNQATTAVSDYYDFCRAKYPQEDYHLSANYRADKPSMVVVTATFDCPETVNEIAISGNVTMVQNAALNYAGFEALSDEYEICEDSIKWYKWNSEEKAFYELRNNHVFELNGLYGISFGIELTAKGKTLDANNGWISTYATLNGNGNNVTVRNYGARDPYTYCEVFFEVGICEVQNEIIDWIVLNGITVPSDGEKPTYTVYTNDPGYEPSGWHNGVFSIHGTYWENASGHVMESGTFVEGQKYTLIVCLKAKAGYSFLNPASDIRAILDGSMVGPDVVAAPAEVDDWDVKVKENFFCKPAPIAELNLSITAPKVGSTPDYPQITIGNITSDESDLLIDDKERAYYKNGIAWFNLTDGEYLDPNKGEVFESGKVYAVRIGLQKDLDQAFSKTIDVKVNGASADVQYYSPAAFPILLSVEYRFALTLPTCAHISRSTIPAVPVTCTQDGMAEYYICDDCHTKFKDYAATQILFEGDTWGVEYATGHDYSAGWVAIGEGQHSLTCSKCKESIVENCQYRDRIVDDTIYYTCVVCHDVVERAIVEDIVGCNHKLGDWQIGFSATAADMTHYRTCECGQNYVEQKCTLYATAQKENETVKYVCNECRREVYKRSTYSDKRMLTSVGEDRSLEINDSEGNLPDDAELNAEQLSTVLSDETLSQIAEKINFDFDVLSNYEISVSLEELAIQPVGAVEITLPATNDKGYAKYKVLYISEKGTLRLYPVTKTVDNKYIFTTDHFSNYILLGLTEDDIRSASYEGGDIEGEMVGGNMEPTEIYIGYGFELPACTFVPKAGWTFDCWEIDGEYYNVGDTYGDVFDDVVVYAVWKQLAVTELVVVERDVTDITISFTLNFVPDYGTAEVLIDGVWTFGDYVNYLEKNNYIFQNNVLENVECWRLHFVFDSTVDVYSDVMQITWGDADAHTHIYEPVYDTDATGHWYDCKVDDCPDPRVCFEAHSGEATCTSEAVCTVCDNVYMLPHDLSDWLIKGYSHYKQCSVCEQEFYKADHSETLTHHELIAATCYDDGMEEYYTCTVCGKHFHDADCLADDEITDPYNTLIIQSLNHCNATYEQGYPAQCGETGENPHYYCPDCDKYFEDGECNIEIDYESVVLIPALEHNFYHHDAMANSCTTNGWIEYYNCINCGGYVLSESAPLEFVDWEEDILIPAAGHKYTEVPETPATCTQNGIKAHFQCTVCEELFVKENEEYVETNDEALTIVATGHVYDDDTDAICNKCEAVRNILTLAPVGGTARVTTENGYENYTISYSFSYVPAFVKVKRYNDYTDAWIETAATIPQKADEVVEFGIAAPMEKEGVYVFALFYEKDGDEEKTENFEVVWDYFYKISFDCGEGSGEMEAVLSNDDFYSVPECTFTAPEGKRFAHWNGGGEVNVGDNLPLSNDWVLTAIFETIPAIVTNPASGSAKPGESYNISYAFNVMPIYLILQYSDNGEWTLYANDLDEDGNAFAVPAQSEAATISFRLVAEYPNDEFVYSNVFTVNWSGCQHKNVTKYDEVPATCAETGKAAYWYCADCEKYFEDAECAVVIEGSIDDYGIIPVNDDHDYGELVQAKEPDETTAGNVAYYVCSVCGRYFDAQKAEIDAEDVIIPATGIVELNAVVSMKAGEKVGDIVVTTDDDRIIVFVKTVGKCENVFLIGDHLVTNDDVIEYNEWYAVKVIFVAKDGYKLASNPDAKINGIDGKFGSSEDGGRGYGVALKVTECAHDYDAVVTAPTCTERGYTTHTCSLCGDSYTDTEVPVVEHTWGDWTVKTAATVDAEGVEARVCSVCDKEETRAIAKLGDVTAFTAAFEAAKNANRDELFAAIKLAIVEYDKLNDEQQASVANEYGQLKELAESYNATIEDMNQSYNDAAASALSVLAAWKALAMAIAALLAVLKAIL